MNAPKSRVCGYDPADLPARLVREARPVYGDPESLEELRHVAEAGLPVAAVKVLQAELKRFGVRRASEFVNRIVPRATRKRRKLLKREEGEAVLRVAATVALAVYVWGEEEAAAEFLVPAEHLRRSWDALNRNPERFQAGARLFKVSQIVIARRALDLELIARDDFLNFYQEYMTQEQRKASNKPAGGDFWANQNFRIGRKFGTAVVSAAREGRLLYSEAYQLTGLFGNAFERFATRLESRTT